MWRVSLKSNGADGAVEHLGLKPAILHSPMNNMGLKRLA
jgi:hypothetical protein